MPLNDRTKHLVSARMFRIAIDLFGRERSEELATMFADDIVHPVDAEATNECGEVCSIPHVLRRIILNERTRSISENIFLGMAMGSLIERQDARTRQIEAALDIFDKIGDSAPENVKKEAEQLRVLLNKFKQGYQG